MSRKVIFLDIDGVISPTFDGEHMRQKDEYEKRQPKYDSTVYTEKSAVYAGEDEQKWIHPYDFYTIETRWDQASIRRINELLRNTDSVCVLESSWINTYNTSERMKAVLCLAGMEERYAGIAPGGSKNEGIDAYRAEHPEIDRFIVIDDDDYWDFAKEYGMYFIQPHHLLGEQDCMAAEDVLTNEYNISHNKTHLKIEDISGKDAGWISAEYFAVESGRETVLVFNHVTAEYPNEQKRIVLVRHLIAETKRLASQENYPQNIVVSILKELSEGVMLHHRYTIWEDGLQLPDGRILSSDDCAVIWMESGSFIVRDWAKQYCLSNGRKWDHYRWRY